MTRRSGVVWWRLRPQRGSDETWLDDQPPEVLVGPGLADVVPIRRPVLYGPRAVWGPLPPSGGA